MTSKKIVLLQHLEENSRLREPVKALLDGFPEARQSRWLEPWLVRLARRLEAEYLGFVIKGGVEGIQVQPPWMMRNLLGRFEALGRVLGETGTLDSGLIDELAQPETLSAARRAVYRALIKTGLAKWYWNDQLRKNNAFEKRFARPYDPPGRAGPWHSSAEARWAKWPSNRPKPGRLGE